MASLKRLQRPRTVTCAGAPPSFAALPPDTAARDAISPSRVTKPPPSLSMHSEDLQVIRDVDLALERSGLHGEIDELLKLRLVLVREILGHEIAHHRHRIDHVFRRESIFGQVLAGLRRIFIDEARGFLPGGGESFRCVGAALDELGGDGAAGCESIGARITQYVVRDDARLDSACNTELA